MSENNRVDRFFEDLRRKAEKLVDGQETPETGVSGEDMEKLIHELQVHQAELEIQNDELKDAQQALEKSRQRYRDLFDLAPVGHFTLDENGIVIESNIIGASQLGLDRTRLTGKPFYIYVDKESLAKYNRYLNGTSGHRFREGCELLLNRADGTSFWANVVAAPVRHSNKTEQYLMVVTDISRLMEVEADLRKEITSHEETEEQLRNSEQKYRETTDLLPEMVFETDGNHRLTYVNETGKEMFRLNDRRIREGVGLEELLADFERKRLKNYLPREIKSERQRSVKFTAEAPPGEYFSVILSASPIFRNSVLQGWRGIVLDITDQEKLEAAMAERLRYEEHLAGCSQVLFADEGKAVEKALRHLQQAAKCSTVFLYKNTETPDHGMVAEKIKEVVDSDGTGKELPKSVPYASGFPHWRDLLAKGHIVQGGADDFFAAEQEFLRLNTLESVLVLPVAIDGEWSGFLGFADYSEPRIWDRENINLLRTAAWIVGIYFERKLNEDRLKQSRDDAEVANRAKSLFLSNMSHEIRTPISGIIGIAEMMEANIPPAEVENLRLIKDSAKSLLTIINDILDLSKIEAHQLALVEEPFRIGELVKKTVSPYQLDSKNRDVSISYTVDADVPDMISSDPYRVKQILLNLISNAVKFTNQGKVGVKVGVSRVLPDKKVELLVKVSDTGAGISKDDQELIFQNFKQGDDSLKKAHQGTGLGLAICKRLVGMMGGSIWVESVPGEGSTFFFTIVAAVSDEEAAGDDEDSTHRQGNGSGAGKTILLAEDNAINRKFISHFLEKRGFSVVAAERGDEAVALAAANDFDCILMDIQMPGMDGMEATRKIRAQGERYVPIIALTANAMKGDKERFLDSGMDGYASKPVDVEQLYQLIDSQLRKHEPEG